MDVVALVALVIAITQVLKKFIPISPDILAIVVSVGVVAFKAVETSTPLTFALIPLLIQVIVGAIGAFKVAVQVAKKSSGQ